MNGTTIGLILCIIATLGAVGMAEAKSTVGATAFGVVSLILLYSVGRAVGVV